MVKRKSIQENNVSQQEVLGSSSAAAAGPRFLRDDINEDEVVSVDPALRNLNVSILRRQQCVFSIQVDLLQYSEKGVLLPKKKKKATKKAKKTTTKKRRTYTNKYTEKQLGMMVHSFVADMQHRGVFHPKAEFLIEYTEVYVAVIEKITVLLYHILRTLYPNRVYYSRPEEQRRHHGTKVKKSKGETRQDTYKRRKLLSIEKASSIMSHDHFELVRTRLKKQGEKESDEDGADAFEAIFHGLYYLDCPEKFAVLPYQLPHKEPLVIDQAIPLYHTKK